MEVRVLSCAPRKNIRRTASVFSYIFIGKFWDYFDVTTIQKDMIVRNARIEDAEAACHLLVSTQLAKTEGLKVRVETSMSLSSETCFVAVHDGEIVGVLLAVFNGFHVFMSHMAVDEKYRGQGIGKMLHANLVSASTQLGAKGIITDSWLSATGFYYELGYRLPGAVFVIRDLDEK